MHTHIHTLLTHINTYTRHTHTRDNTTNYEHIYTHGTSHTQKYLSQIEINEENVGKINKKTTSHNQFLD